MFLKQFFPGVLKKFLAKSDLRGPKSSLKSDLRGPKSACAVHFLVKLRDPNHPSNLSSGETFKSDLRGPFLAEVSKVLKMFLAKVFILMSTSRGSGGVVIRTNDNVKNSLKSIELTRSIGNTVTGRD